MIKAINKSDPELVEQIRSGQITIHQAKRYAHARAEQASERKAARMPGKRSWTITDNQDVIKCHALITDPPYGITNESWEPDDIETFTKNWCLSVGASKGATLGRFKSSRGMLVDNR